MPVLPPGLWNLKRKNKTEIKVHKNSSGYQFYVKNGNNWVPEGPRLPERNVEGFFTNFFNQGNTITGGGTPNRKR
jgi:hypothetical protein